MKTCSLENFLKEMNPWLSSEYLYKAVYDGKGNFVIHFLDGTKNSYQVSDCNKSQIEHIIDRLLDIGIQVEH